MRARASHAHNLPTQKVTHSISPKRKREEEYDERSEPIMVSTFYYNRAPEFTPDCPDHTTPCHPITVRCPINMNAMLGHKGRPP